LLGVDAGGQLVFAPASELGTVGGVGADTAPIHQILSILAFNYEMAVHSVDGVDFVIGYQDLRLEEPLVEGSDRGCRGWWGGHGLCSFLFI
jgi:hypothetical protein